MSLRCPLAIFQETIDLLKSLILLARPKGFEPLTPRFVVWCSIQLSYGRLCRGPRAALGARGGRAHSYSLGRGLARSLSRARHATAYDLSFPRKRASRSPNAGGYWIIRTFAARYRRADTSGRFYVGCGCRLAVPVRDTAQTVRTHPTPRAPFARFCAGPARPVHISNAAAMTAEIAWEEVRGRAIAVRRARARGSRSGHASRGSCGLPWSRTGTE